MKAKNCKKRTTVLSLKNMEAKVWTILFFTQKLLWNQEKSTINFIEEQKRAHSSIKFYENRYCTFIRNVKRLIKLVRWTSRNKYFISD